MTEARASIHGNLIADPVLTYTANGRAVTNFRLASTHSRFDRAAQEWKDETTVFLDVACWAHLAENVAESVRRGDAVLATGRLVRETWTDSGGKERDKIKLVADHVGPELSFRAASLRRVTRERPAMALVRETSDDPEGGADTEELAGSIDADSLEPSSGPDPFAAESIGSSEEAALAG